VGDAEFIESVDPLGQFVAVRALERQVIETDTPFVERGVIGELWELVKPDQGLTADQPYDKSKWSRVLIEQWRGVEQSLVPRHTLIQIVHRQHDVGDGRKFGQRCPFDCSWCLTLSSEKRNVHRHGAETRDSPWRWLDARQRDVDLVKYSVVDFLRRRQDLFGNDGPRPI